MVIALAVTREGLPVRSWVFPGNTTDVNTVATIKADLKDWKLGRALFVADSGMNSQDNRRELARACGKYLLAMRLGSVAEVKEEVLTRPGRFKILAENLQARGARRRWRTAAALYSCARQGAPTWRCKSSTGPTGGTVSRTARVSIERWNLKEAAGKALA